MPLLALFYSWLASAIISFGVYFNLGSLSGNLFANQALLGLLKVKLSPSERGAGKGRAGG